MDPDISSNILPGWLLVSNNPHQLALIICSRVSQPMGHGRIFDESRPGIIERWWAKIIWAKMVLEVP